MKNAQLRALRSLPQLQVRYDKHIHPSHSAVFVPPLISYIHVIFHLTQRPPLPSLPNIRLQRSPVIIQPQLQGTIPSSCSLALPSRLVLCHPPPPSPNSLDLKSDATRESI
jgi:hypothetical protein